MSGVPFRWTSCPQAPLVWIGFRESLLHLLFTPGLVLPLLAGLLWIATGALPIARSLRGCLMAAALVSASLLYTPLGTSLLSSWLLDQLPPPTAAQPSVAVLVGRGPEIARITTSLAAGLERRGLVDTIYVSGDQRATAERLVSLGVPPVRVAGDDCARTTWENGTRTTAWLRQQNLGAPLPAITLITDPWQLPRASLVFRHLGVDVRPLATPAGPFSAREQNQLALRESAGILLYRLQGRLSRPNDPEAQGNTDHQRTQIRRTTTTPRLRPELLSVVRIASQRSAKGTQTDG
jgi:uncharacterized SAM-binding protein YcdF (DUF218 family)